MTNGTNGGNGGNPVEGAPPQLNVLVQYTKDFSFENPNSPHSLSPRSANRPRKSTSRSTCRHRA